VVGWLGFNPGCGGGPDLVGAQCRVPSRGGKGASERAWSGWGGAAQGPSLELGSLSFGMWFGMVVVRTTPGSCNGPSQEVGCSGTWLGSWSGWRSGSILRLLRVGFLLGLLTAG
jgi:hypothetical protein